MNKAAVNCFKIKRKLFYWREMSFFLCAYLSPWKSDMPDGLDFAENLHKFTKQSEAVDSNF
jgi:hypothetical protein